MSQAEDFRADGSPWEDVDEAANRLDRRSLARERRRSDPLDLTDAPIRKRGRLVGQWHLDNESDQTAFLNIIKESLYPVLARRHIVAQQAEAARSALADTTTVMLRRYRQRGLVVRWHAADGTAYWLAIRETDKLTARFDSLQYQLGRDKAERDQLLRRRLELGAA